MLQQLTPSFDLTPEHMDARLFARITRPEFFALILQIFLVLGFVYLDTKNLTRPFYDYYFSAHSGVFYYGFWMMPVVQGLSLLPAYTGVILWAWLNIAGVWFTTRVFGGNVPLTLISFQMIYVVFYGNIIGITIGGLGLMWWALCHRRTVLAGVAFLIAATKFQTGLPIGLVLLLLANVSWGDRLRVMLVMSGGVLVTLLLYPDWPLLFYEWMQTTPPDPRGSIALWRWFEAWTLILWIPLLLIKLPRAYLLIAFISTLALTAPYFQQTDLLALFVMTTGWVPLLGNLGYIFFMIGKWSGLPGLVVVPLVVYIWVLSHNLRGKQNAGTA